MIYVIYRQLSDEAPAKEQAEWFLSSIAEASSDSDFAVVEYSDTDRVVNNIARGDVVYFRNIGSRLKRVKLIVAAASRVGAIVIDPYLQWQHDNGEVTGPRNKWDMYNEMIAEGISTPRTEKITLEDFINNEYTGIIKTVVGGRQGNGTYVYLSSDSERKNAIIDDIMSKPREGKDGLLVQEYIPNRGDIRVVTVGGRSVGAFKRKPKDINNLKMDSSTGRSKGLRNPRSDVLRLAADASYKMGIHVASMDMVRDRRTGRLYIVDLNESPTLRIMYVRTGRDVPQIIMDYLNEVHRTKQVRRNIWET